MTDEVKQGVPMGGSEIILANLRRAFPDYFPVFDDPSQDTIQVIVSRPQQVKLDDNKPKILWLQDLPSDPSSAPLADAGYRSQFNRLVCVSHWQQQQYNAVLRIPFAESMVIKNAVPILGATLPKPKDKLRFIYTSTPHRGLAILAAAADALVKERQDWELHVYSSLHIYGWHDADKEFEKLYDILRANPCVVYHGSKSNAEVRQAVIDAHVFVYPSVYMETSCMAIQEAMMAGCLAITDNLGALPETCGQWAWMFPVDERGEQLAQVTLSHMRYAIEHYDDADLQQVLKDQITYFQKFWSFESRLNLWRDTFAAVAAEGPRKEMLVIE